MATGLFNTARIGANLRSRKYAGRNDTLERFAEELSKHDLLTGDEGGQVTVVASRIGVSTSHAHTMLRRIKAKLGPQAR